MQNCKINKEKLFIPSITLGIDDVAGTGRNASEYIVASKNFNQTFRYSLGILFLRLIL